MAATKEQVRALVEANYNKTPDPLIIGQVSKEKRTDSIRDALIVYLREIPQVSRGAHMGEFIQFFASLSIPKFVVGNALRLGKALVELEEKANTKLLAMLSEVADQDDISLDQKKRIFHFSYLFLRSLQLTLDYKNVDDTLSPMSGEPRKVGGWISYEVCPASAKPGRFDLLRQQLEKIQTDFNKLNSAAEGKVKQDDSEVPTSVLPESASGSESKHQAEIPTVLLDTELLERATALHNSYNEAVSDLYDAAVCSPSDTFDEGRQKIAKVADSHGLVAMQRLAQRALLLYQRAGLTDPDLIDSMPNYSPPSAFDSYRDLRFCFAELNKCLPSQRPSYHEVLQSNSVSVEAHDEKHAEDHSVANPVVDIPSFPPVSVRNFSQATGSAARGYGGLFSGEAPSVLSSEEDSPSNGCRQS